jgi:hypothetical protein
MTPGMPTPAARCVYACDSVCSCGTGDGALEFQRNLQPRLNVVPQVDIAVRAGPELVLQLETPGDQPVHASGSTAGECGNFLRMGRRAQIFRSFKK